MSERRAGALSRYRICDFTGQLSGAGATRWLAAFGADVIRHYPRPICPACQSTRYTWDLSSGRGVVHTWTIVHGPTLPVFRDQVPYNVVDDAGPLAAGAARGQRSQGT